MAWTREGVHAALKTLLDSLVTAGTFKTVTREYKAFTDVAAADCPYLGIVARPELEAAVKGLGPIDRLQFELAIYSFHGSGTGVVGATAMNALLDAVDLAIKPSPVSGFQTLGGTVNHVYRKGNIERYEVQSDIATAFYPTEVLVGQDNLGVPGQYVFDSGWLYGIPQATTPQGTAMNVSPVQFGALRGVTITGTREIAYQGNQLVYKVLPMTAGQTITGSAQVGSINGHLLDQIVFGKDLVTGATKMDHQRAYTIPATPGPYTVAVVPPSSGVYSRDLGVLYASTGLVMRKVSGSPAAGQYSLTGSTYTFNAADQGAGVVISYLYTVATGSTVTIMQAYKAETVLFQLVLCGEYNGKQMTAVFDNVVTDRFALPLALEQFMIMDFGFEILAGGDVGETVGTISLEV